MNQCDSFASKVNQNESESKNKMIRSGESKTEKNFLIHLANQNHFVIFDSPRRIKVSRFGPSPENSLDKKKV